MTQNDGKGLEQGDRVRIIEYLQFHLYEVDNSVIKVQLLPGETGEFVHTEKSLGCAVVIFDKYPEFRVVISFSSLWAIG